MANQKNNALYAKNDEIIEKASNQYAIVSTLMTARESDMISINVTDDVELLFRSTISIHECEEMIDNNHSYDAIGATPTRKTAYKRERYSASSDNLAKVNGALYKKYNEQVVSKKRKIKLKCSVIFIALAVLLAGALFGLTHIIFMRSQFYEETVYYAQLYSIYYDKLYKSIPVLYTVAAFQIGGGMIALFATFFSVYKEWGFWLLTFLGVVVAVIGGFVYGMAMQQDNDFLGVIALTFLASDGIIAVACKICCLKLNFATITDKSISKAHIEIWKELNCSEPIKQFNDHQAELEKYDQSCLDNSYYSEMSTFNLHISRLNNYNNQLQNIIDAHKALIEKSTVLPPSFKDARSIVYIYRELKDGLSDTLKEAKQRCEAKKDTEDFRAKVLYSIERGFNALDNHLSAQMSAAMAQLELSQSCAFAELQAQQNRFAKEQSAQLNSAIQQQSNAIGLIASKNESYIESAKKNDEKMQESLKKIQEEVKKKNNSFEF